MVERIARDKQAMLVYLVNLDTLSNPPIEILADFICLLLRKGGLSCSPANGRAIVCLFISPLVGSMHETCVAKLKGYVYLSSLGTKGAVSPLGLTEGSINISLNKVGYSS